MTEGALTRARAGDEDAFAKLVDPFRGELQLHCYRILGSVQDAEDTLQETLVAAWAGLARFEERSSLRAWLYRIATNRCLNALRDRSRRPTPKPSDRPFRPPEPTQVGEPIWLDPYPDAMLEDLTDILPGPDARYELRETVELAFITALQHLAPSQRAVLVLRDVLGFHTAEVADMLDRSEDSVKGSLKRARAALDKRLPPDRERAPSPDSPEERALVSRFADAFEADDVDGVVALLTEDAWFTMPPSPLEYQGPVAIAALFRMAATARGGRRFTLVPTRANTQPAFGVYVEDPHGPIAHVTGLMVLSLQSDRITAITRFLDNSLMPRFGLPRTLPHRPPRL
jgi:RNA polymerase sigma-70 factor (ECF subfamily)